MRRGDPDRGIRPDIRLGSPGRGIRRGDPERDIGRDVRGVLAAVRIGPGRPA